MDLQDPRLLERLRAGERGAFDDLARRAGPELLRLARRLLDDDDAARDVRQEVLVRAVRSLDRIESTAMLGPWLVRVTVNACRDERRRDAARGAAHERSRDQRPAPAPEDPARQLERADDAERVALAVRSLPPLEREVVVLRHYHDLSFAEIADVQGAPPTTVRSRMARGLERLAERLREPTNHDTTQRTPLR
ncbi:MAG: sigma-70 family RNA polymerase sigma factor [Planctomycetota bacterium]